MKYLAIFGRTAGGIALTVLLAAQALNWADKSATITNATVVAWGLLGAAIAGLIAVGWAFIGTPATTVLGKSLRSAVQALLATPLASLAIDSLDDVRSIGNLVWPTVVSTALAFAVAYLSNRGAVPTVQSNANVGADFAGTTPTAP